MSAPFFVTTVPAPVAWAGARETIPRWSRGSRLALGAWTFAMPVSAAGVGLANLARGTDPPPVLVAATCGLFVLHALITLFYAAFAGQNARIARTRTAWMVALVLAGPITIPVYWLVHVWRAPYVGSPGVDGGPPSGPARVLGPMVPVPA